MVKKRKCHVFISSQCSLVRSSFLSYKVSPMDLTDLHTIRYELGKDLMPLVLANTQYSIEKNKQTLFEFDLPRIQQQLISRFLLGKPLITLDVSKQRKSTGAFFKIDFSMSINQKHLERTI